MPFIFTKINAIDKHRHLYVIKILMNLFREPSIEDENTAET